VYFTLPPNFDRGNADHYARLLLVEAKMARVKAPDLLLVAAIYRFLIVPFAPDELHGTYSLLRMTIGTQARKEGPKRRQVGHELAHIVQEVVGVLKPHDEGFTERIRLCASMPAWSLRPLVEGGRNLDEIASAYPLLSPEEIVTRVLLLPTNRRFPKKTRAAQARLLEAAGGLRGPWSGDGSGC
jgi:hypothetical protein